MNCTIMCCMNCTDRQVGCHSTCEIYKEQKAQWDKIRAEEKEQQRQKYCRVDSILEGKRRMTKGRKKK